MNFEVTLLGINSALPAYGRHPSAQVLQIQEQYYLIDCGEGTQMRMNDFDIRRGKIRQIFISHLHGDHIYGLIGLLTSYALMGRTDSLDIFSPEGLQEIIEVQLRHGGGGFPFPIKFHKLDTEVHQLIFSDKRVEVFSIPLIHRIPTCGFLFKEKQRPRNIIPEQIEKFNIPFSLIPGIKDGKDLALPNGAIVPNAELTLPPLEPRAYAYCSDTRYTETILPYINGVDLLYHESTFLHEAEERAKETMHTTALQAGTIAQKANVGLLILGHFSSRYPDLEVLRKEAATVFDRVVIGVEGQTYKAPFKGRVLE
ncbi:MAG: ribonuclease Z [Saprospiraceae bacterium]|nr:MAG: ribonuclease Z [Saprospiraceae bacterium]